jgi:hypothetical protein
MAIEHASVRAVRKPWGSADLRRWSDIDDDGDAIGELWFQRADMNAPDPALLVKLLFTTEPLSIQVHPDDAFAQSNGMVHGKTEAWYVLSATPDAKVAVGLKRQLNAPQLRASSLLVAGPPFVLERIDLAPNSNWELHAEREIWVIVVKGHARVGHINAFVGGGIVLEADRTIVEVGSECLGGLCAYPGSEPSPSLLRDLDFRNAGSPVYSAKARP